MRREAAVFGLAAAVLILLHAAFAFHRPAQLYSAEEYRNLRLAASILGEGEAWEGLVQTWPQPLNAHHDISLFDYQFQAWDGGTLVASIVLVPLVAVLGLTPAAVKAGATVWALGTLAAWALLGGLLAGRRGRWTALLLFACGPPAALALGSFHFANHMESAVFLPLIAVSWIWTARAPSHGRAAWTGLVSGFAVYFSPLNLLPVAVGLVASPILLGRGFIRWMPAVLVGAGLGFSPWLGRNDLGASGGFSAQGRSLVELLAQVLGGGDRVQLQGQLGESLFVQFAGLAPDWSPEALARLERGWRAALIGSAPVLLLSAVWAREEGRRARELLFAAGLAGAVVLVLPWLLSGAGEFNHQRMSPAIPAAVGLISLAVASLPDVRRLSAVGLAAALAWAGVNLWADASMAWVDQRPSEPLRAWVMSAIPSPHVVDRLEVAVPGLDPDQIAPLNRALEGLLPASPTGGVHELRGLREGLTRAGMGCRAHGGEARSLESWEEARAFGAGLTVSCRSARAGSAICGDLVADQVDVCVRGARSEWPPPWVPPAPWTVAPSSG